MHVCRMAVTMMLGESSHQHAYEEPRNQTYVVSMPVVMVVTMAMPVMMVTSRIHSPQIYCQAT